MGGNALKNIYTRRYTRDEYYSLIPSVVATAQSISGVVQCVDIPSYRLKESFGDADILYTTDTDRPLCVDNITSIFSPLQVIRNTSVISFDVNEFQIDMIHSPKSEFKYALSYFSYNDLGNLIGRITKQFGLKHGHNGLHLPLRSANNIFANITVSLDYLKTLQFIGLDPNVFKSGFDTLTDIFDYVRSSPYFSPELYKLENLNNVARTRDKKRSTYRDFLESNKSWTGTVTPMYSDDTRYLHKIFDFFPGVEEEFTAIMKDVAVLNHARTKFNGDLVSKLTGLVGKELGQFMQVLTKLPDFNHSTIAYISEESIKERINEQFSKFQIQ